MQKFAVKAHGILFLETPTVILTYLFVYVQEDCCGVNYYTDWRNTKFGGRRIFAVPDTCCKTNEFGCGFKFETDDINRRVSFVLLIVV